MPRTVQEILDHAEELAARFEQNYEPAGNPEVTALGELYLAVQARAAAERAVAEQVAVARAGGVSWDVIGGILGTNGEAVRQRYGSPRKTPAKKAVKTTKDIN